jgi:hypothetical protein
MERYHNLFVWMLIPFVVVQLGIFPYYWPKFTSVTWEIHIHYWLVTVWYGLLILQPYWIQHKQISNHKTWGIFGLVLAGGVIFTGYSLLDIPLKIVASYDTSRPGPPVEFYYGTLVIEFLMMTAFVVAIAQCIRKRKIMDEHAWWLICGAFYMIAPALGRGMIVFWIQILSPENFTPLFPLLSTEIIYLTLFTLFVYKFGRFNHLATYIGYSLVLIRLLRIPIGSSPAIQEFLHAFIKWH